MADDRTLLEVLGTLRERGAIGESSLIGAVAHASSFVEAIPADAAALLDLGSGGGLPGLVIAMRLPHLRVVLTDRRERRMDLVRRAVSALGIEDRVSVQTADVRRLRTDPLLRGAFDVVTARSFASPLVTMECAGPFLRAAGLLIVSEPPSTAGRSGERWSADMLAACGFVLDQAYEHVRRFRRVDGGDRGDPQSAQR